ncbi:unnamed protein product [Camellia sinensis]
MVGIYIWGITDPFGQEPIKKLFEQKDWRYSGIHALAISGTGYLYTGSGDKSIKAWSLQDYSLPYTMNGHKSVVSTLAVCNGVLYSGSWDGTVRLWCLSDHSPLTVLGEDVPGNVTFVLSLGTYGDALVVAHENGCMKFGKKLKKNSVALDIVNFGEEDKGKAEKLEALLAALPATTKSSIVVRGGKRENISIYDIVVGDVIPLKIGDQVLADGIIISGHSLAIDESSMTGESKIVTSVGINTEWGLLMLCSSNNQLYSPSQALVRTHMVWKKDKKRIRRVSRIGVLNGNASTLCGLSKNEDESSLHVLQHCPFVWRVCLPF